MKVYLLACFVYYMLYTTYSLSDLNRNRMSTSVLIQVCNIHLFFLSVYDTWNK